MIFRRNVLILHQGALGDFVLTWPLALAMGRMFPQSRIIYVSPSSKGKLAEKAIRVESADSEAGWHALFGTLPTVPEPVAKLLAGAHTIFSYISRSNDTFDHNLHDLAPHAKIYTMSTRDHAAVGHAAEWAVDDLRLFPVAAEGVRQMLRSIADRGVGVQRLPGNAVIIHPGSGGESKNWPAGRYIELAGLIESAGRDVKFVLGEVELERWPKELIAKFAAAGDVVKPVSYLDMFELLRGVSAFIGNDSGPGHLAAVMGVPTLTLFVDSDAEVWHPIGPARRQMVGKYSPADVMKVLDDVMSHAKPQRVATAVTDD